MVIPEAVYSSMHLAGRILFGGLFVISGMNQLLQPGATAVPPGRAGAKYTAMLTAILAAVGGALLVLGWHRFVGAGLVFISLVVVSFMTNAFWSVTDPAAKATATARFQRDMALAGAALFIAYYARYTWPLSLGG